MSRHPSTAECEERNIAEDYVNYICNQAVPKAMTLQEIKLETEKDSSLQALIKAIETDMWTDPEVQEYKKVKDELLVYKGTILRGNRIVEPRPSSIRTGNKSSTNFCGSIGRHLTRLLASRHAKHLTRGSSKLPCRK